MSELLPRLITFSTHQPTARELVLGSLEQVHYLQNVYYQLLASLHAEFTQLGASLNAKITPIPRGQKEKIDKVLCDFGLVEVERNKAIKRMEWKAFGHRERQRGQTKEHERQTAILKDIERRKQEEQQAVIRMKDDVNNNADSMQQAANIAVAEEDVVQQVGNLNV